MRKIAPFLECPKVSAMIQEHLIEEAQLQFNQFVTDLIKAMVITVFIFAKFEINNHRILGRKHTRTIYRSYNDLLGLF